MIAARDVSNEALSFKSRRNRNDYDAFPQARMKHSQVVLSASFQLLPLTLFQCVAIILYFDGQYLVDRTAHLVFFTEDIFQDANEGAQVSGTDE